MHADQVLVLQRPHRGEVRLPKGHIEIGESAAEAAVREVTEESGYSGLEIVADLGEQVVEFDLRENHMVRCEHYFLMVLRDKTATAHSGEDQYVPVWCSWQEALSSLTFEFERIWVRRAWQHPARARGGVRST